MKPTLKQDLENLLPKLREKMKSETDKAKKHNLKIKVDELTKLRDQL